MKTTIDELMNPIAGFLLTIESIRDDVKDALDEIDNDGKALRKDKRAKWTLPALKSARETLTAAHDELDELYATVLSSSPESVQEEIGGGGDIDTSPEGIQKLQAQMRGYLKRVGDNPTRMACEAACTAAEVMFRTQLAMAIHTYEAMVAAAEQARDEALRASASVYQDTCMQAVETCGALENKQNARGKRTLQ